MKYFTMSYDDGVEQDKKMLEILESFGLNCVTFNINSGLFGERHVAGGDNRPRNGFYSVAHNHFRIPEDEIAQVYARVEVAAHGLLHLRMQDQPYAELETEILQDRKNLQDILGKPVEGFVFAYGVACDAAHEIIRNAGFRYTRGVHETRSWKVPSDFLRLQPTCWHVDPETMPMLDRFVQEETEEDRLFYIWGHGYELDYNLPTASYEYFKRILDKVAGRDDIICCSNAQAVRALTGK